MSQILLQTKINVPPRRPSLVQRSRLVDRATRGLGGKLVLISAPAGYGKTTFAVDWLHQLATSQGEWSDSHVGWLSLDAADSDPATFMTYVVAAIRQAISDEMWGEGVRVLIQSADTPVLAAVSLLLNEVVVLSRPLILVLDDYHIIRHEVVHQMMATVLDHQPANLKLVLVTRAEPPLPLARLRLRAELCELEAADMRFSRAETAEFFRSTQGITLTPDQVAALDAQAEGWAAGLQAAALSLQPGQDVDRFLAGFEGQQRFVLDYLGDEVYRQQPAEIRSFLQKTAICDRICAPLCEALLDDSDWETVVDVLPQHHTREPASAQAILNYLDAANLFVIPLDDQRQWYRYHNLFRDFLQTRLAREQPEQIATNHRRAAVWFAQNGLIDEAIRHRLAAGDDKEAAALMAANARAKIMRGEGVTVQRWLDALPADLVRSNPHLCLARATVLTFVRDIDGMETYLDAAERALPQLPEMSPAEADRVLGGVAVYRAMIALWQGQNERTIQLCHQALERFQSHDSYSTGLASLLLGMTHQKANLQQAGAAFADALAVGKRTGDVMLVNTAASSMAAAHVGQGKLHEAADLYREAIALAADKQGRPFPVAAGAFIGLAQIISEWNELDIASDYLSQATVLAQRANLPDTLMEARYVETLLCWARQDWEQARAALAAGEALTQSHPRPEVERRLAALRARIALAEGRLDEAATWARECGLTLHDVPAGQDEGRYVVLARVMIAQAQEQAAPTNLTQIMHVLSQMEASAVATGHVHDQIVTLILQALAYDADKEPDAALAALEQAVTLAEPGGYVRVFADEGEVLGKLLHQLARRATGSTVDYVGTLLAAIEPPRTANERLVEPLTDREIEVLKLIVAGLSNRDIADTLVIAVSTVKRHINHIYGKLEVDSRAQAIARTRELDLLTD